MNGLPGQPVQHTRGKGKAAEEVAVDYLLGLGYELLERNFQTRHGEIDCILRDPSGVLVFVEVKSSRGGSYGHPFFRINRPKQQKIALMARIYRQRVGHTGPCRFDAVALYQGRIEHLKNAFLAA